MVRYRVSGLCWRRRRDIKALFVLLFHVSHLDGVIVSFLPVGHGGGYSRFRIVQREASDKKDTQNQAAKGKEEIKEEIRKEAEEVKVLTTEREKVCGCEGG